MNQQLHLVISIDKQRLGVLRGDDMIREFAISTSLHGTGFVKDSYRTPLGRFRIAEKIGEGEPLGTIFKGRVPLGIWHPSDPADDDLILSRILRLDGLDVENANTMERCIYIHGTNHEEMLGMPVSHGCIRLANAEMIELYSMVLVGTMVEICSAKDALNAPLMRRSDRLNLRDGISDKVID